MTSRRRRVCTTVQAQRTTPQTHPKNANTLNTIAHHSKYCKHMKSVFMQELRALAPQTYCCGVSRVSGAFSEVASLARPVSARGERVGEAEGSSVALEMNVCACSLKFKERYGLSPI